jgi:hypothetical protein
MTDSNPGGAMATAAFEKNGIVGQVPRAARLVSASLEFLRGVLKRQFAARYLYNACTE